MYTYNRCVDCWFGRHRGDCVELLPMNVIAKRSKMKLSEDI